MNIAAVLLTGGASRRMGQDKAALVPETWTESLAVRTARLLRAVADPAIEVGGSVTDLVRVEDRHRHAGPLAALAGAGVVLRTMGWTGQVLVVATDLPQLSAGMLAWLAEHPAPGAVVPLDPCGRPQPLCARYPFAALEEAARLVAAGATRMAELLAGTEATMCGPADWSGAAGGTGVLADVDSPGDLAALADVGAEIHG